MKKWIFAAMAVLTIFAMTSCRGGGGDSTPPTVWKVTYNANGFTGQAVPDPVEVNDGDAITLPTLSNPADGSQEFEGWGLSAARSGTLLAGGTSYKPTADVTLYVWIKGSTTVTFDYDYDGAPTPPAPVKLTGASFEDDQIPFPSASRTGWYFGGWYTGKGGTGQVVAFNTSIPLSVTLYAWWLNDTLSIETGDEQNAELLYLNNGAVALYQFEIPVGKTLADYESVTYQIKVTEATRHIWDKEGIRYTRLYGVYKDGVNVTTEPLGDGEIKILNSNNYNNDYILHSGLTKETVVSAVTPNTWSTLTLALRGNEHSGTKAANKADNTKTGTVYLGVGVSCQRIASENATQFIQMIKEVTLVSTDGQSDVVGVQPYQKSPTFPQRKYEVAQLVSYVDPILMSWRGAVNRTNADNWRDIVPHVEGGGSDRGDPPDPATLTKVDLGGYTYIHTGGNVWNQRGWASFEEAGRANDQDYNGLPSSVVFGNFRKAWYLELKTGSAPSGTVSLIWMGGYGGWNSNDATSTSGGEVEGVSEIFENDDDTYTIRFLLPEALASYTAYYSNNTVWAALALGYWGGGTTADPNGSGQINLWDLDIQEAYLLLEAGDVEAPAAGISVAIPFTLSNPPEGGNLIADVLWNGTLDQLEVKAADGLSNFRWYVDGVLNPSNANPLIVSNIQTNLGTKNKYTITVSAQDINGKWKSQAVDITLTN